MDSKDNNSGTLQTVFEDDEEYGSSEELPLQLAQPGTKFQYYRPVFQDFEDVLNALKTRLLCIANVSDDIRQAALNQLDDCIPPPPPGLPPTCPSSPAYSPVSWSPSTEDNDEYEAEDAPSDSPNIENESTIIE